MRQASLALLAIVLVLAVAPEALAKGAWSSTRLELEEDTHVRTPHWGSVLVRRGEASIWLPRVGPSVRPKDLSTVLLHEGTLAAGAVVDGVELPAGTRVSFGNEVGGEREWSFRFRPLAPRTICGLRFPDREWVTVSSPARDGLRRRMHGEGARVVAGVLAEPGTLAGVPLAVGPVTFDARARGAPAKCEGPLDLLEGRVAARARFGALELLPGDTFVGASRRTDSSTPEHAIRLRPARTVQGLPVHSVPHDGLGTGHADPVFDHAGRLLRFHPSRAVTIGGVLFESNPQASWPDMIELYESGRVRAGVARSGQVVAGNTLVGLVRFWPDGTLQWAVVEPAPWLARAGIRDVAAREAGAEIVLDRRGVVRVVRLVLPRPDGTTRFVAHLVQRDGTLAPAPEALSEVTSQYGAFAPRAIEWLERTDPSR